MKEIEDNKRLKYMIIVGILVSLSAIIMGVTFIFSSAHLDIRMLISYFKSIELLAMNILPILIFISIVYILTNRLWISFLASSILFVTASLVNKFKLTYRDDPFTLMDIKLFSESIAMTKRYDIEFTWEIITILIALLIITILLKKFFKYKINSTKIRLSVGLIILVLTPLVFKGFYLDEDRYLKLGDKSLINIWSQQQQFQSKGFVYPFIYSVENLKERALEGYDEEKAKSDLEKYSYSDIPSDEKVNVVGIMLEAYNDFSKFDTIEVDPEVYKNFHEIQKQSLHGNLVTNVFAGGTINTERGFLTGFHNHPRYLKNTNSFAWYFKEQGYNTKAMHPIYGWFYNRRNANEMLGFNSFDYYENKYKQEKEEFFDDMDFFDFIIEDYEESADKGQPYFNFTVTYQNHGPYTNEKQVEKEYLKKKPEYNDSDYNIINNYLKGISETDKAIKKLTDYFESKDEPVVVVMFGDHNPWLGENSTGYEMMDINIDLSSKEGFLNYYQTPYIIWGNSKAKQTFDKDFNEQLEDISPNFLMPQLFEYVGWEGNKYMQYLIDLKKDFTVNHELYFKQDGEYINSNNEEIQKKYKDYINLQYYYGRNFGKSTDSSK